MNDQDDKRDLRRINWTCEASSNTIFGRQHDFWIFSRYLRLAHSSYFSLWRRRKAKCFQTLVLVVVLRWIRAPSSLIFSANWMNLAGKAVTCWYLNFDGRRKSFTILGILIMCVFKFPLLRWRPGCTFASSAARFEKKSGCCFNRPQVHLLVTSWSPRFNARCTWKVFSSALPTPVTHELSPPSLTDNMSASLLPLQRVWDGFTEYI